MRFALLRGAVIWTGDEKINWNFYVVKLFEANTLSRKKYDPSLDSQNQDTSFEVMD